METLMKFRDMGLSDNIMHALKKKGFEEPTPIQEAVIPKLMNSHRDLIGQAQTGTGKTAAFGIPILENIDPKNKQVQAIILTPTRELALQVSEELHSLKGKLRIHILPVYGGQSIERQLTHLKKGVHIVVGTPGRVMDHLYRKSLKLDQVRYFILDEADEMLNMGFIDDVKEILSYAPDDRQILLFSATMPREILQLARQYLKDYEKIVVPTKQLTVDLTEQIYYEVSERDKFEALCRIIDLEPEFYGLVFCRTKVDVDQISGRLIDRGYDAEALHGDISQHQRENILRKFKKRRINILVATDVAARGIDIQDLTHVINYSLPQNPESYVHRIGRTGRAGKEGTAITFVTPDEYRKLLYIQKISGARIRKEDLPAAQEIVEMKKNMIRESVATIIKNNDLNKYHKLAFELLEEHDAMDVVAALLKYSFKEELDPSTYKEIEKVTINTSGKSRLFVALGTMDDFTPKKLVEYIEKETGVEGRKIRDVRVFEKFSFITVPFEDAELILEIFKKKKRGKRPIISRARERSRN
jgi:ATP-dependent RNA helicase DeaD